MNIKQTAAFIFAGIICMIGGAHAQTVITIGASAKADHPFSAMDSLLTSISKGNMKGNITLALENGEYSISSPIIIRTPRFGVSDHLTITSKSGLRDSVRIRLDKSAVCCIYLDTCYNLTIRDITLESSYQMAVNINSKCRNVEIRGNRMILPTSTTNRTAYCIGTTSTYTDVDGFRIVGNRLEGGYTNIMLNISQRRWKNTRVDSNHCSGAYNRGIDIQHVDTLMVKGNTVLPRPACIAGYYGMYLSDNMATKIIANHVDMTGATTYLNGGTAFTCVIGDTVKGSEPTLIANNVIVGNNSNFASTTATNYAMYVYGNLKIWHNSIYQAGNGAGCLCASGFLMNLDIKGNQLVCSQYNQYPIRLVPSAQNYKYWKGKTYTDYNNYYSLFGVVASIGQDDIMSITEMQEYTKQDTHSICEQIDWTERLQPKQFATFLMPNIGVGEDFNGNTRDRITAIGAYAPVRLDAAISGFGPTQIAEGSQTVYAELTNNGTDVLTQAEIQWKSDGVTQTSCQWKGKLEIGSTDTIKLGTATMAKGKLVKLDAWVTKPNGGKDMNTYNDTALVRQFICAGKMSGTYTVGNSGKTDFNNLEEAMTALNQCGISGPATLELQSGNFGQLNITDSILGSSAQNRVTIKAAKGAEVVFNNGAEGPSLVLENAANFIFDGLTFGDTAKGLVGVRLILNNSNITFTRCRIYSSFNATTSDTKYFCVDNSNTENSMKFLSNVRFTSNEIRGGYANFSFNYIASSTNQMMYASVYIDSNLIADASDCGIRSMRMGAIRSVTGNTIRSRRNTMNVFYGIYSEYYSQWDKISNNRIHIIKDVRSSGYAMFLGQNTLYGTTRPLYVTNNEIIINSDNLDGYGTGILLSSSDGAFEFHNNSIFIRGYGNLVGMYINGNNRGNRITRNNIVIIDSMDNSMALQSSYDSPAGEREFNNFYAHFLLKKTSGNVGYTTVQELQKVSKKDAYSISMLPEFESGTCLRMKDSLRYVCPTDSACKQDINGTDRSEWTIMGCYHAGIKIGATSKDAALKAILAPKTDEPGTFPVSVILYNNDTAPIRMADITCRVNSSSIVKQYYPYPPLAGHASDTILIGSFSFTKGQNSMLAWVDMSNDINPKNDTARNSLFISEFDIQVRDITTTSPAEGGSRISPNVRIANAGNDSISRIVLHVNVYDEKQKLLDTLVETMEHIGVNDDRIHAFTKKYTVPQYIGKYTLKAFVEAVPKDQKRSNDTLSKQFMCYTESDDSTGIRETSRPEWNLGQNMPNPAEGITVIPYMLPQGAQAAFTVTGPDGRLVRRETMSGDGTAKEIRLQVSGWAAGIYYYVMECNGYRITRKMVIR